MKIQRLDGNAKADILEKLIKRSPNQYAEYEGRVNDILNEVRTRGDDALFDYTERFDKIRLDSSSIKVTEEEFEDAYRRLDPEVLRVIRLAKENIQKFHVKQKKTGWFDTEENGIILGQKITPIENVGVYIPGGKAAYPSSVLMSIIPARAAGVKRIIMTTPPGIDGRVYEGTLVAAKEAGVDEVYKVGGAQAIGAMAFGTKSIKKVDKIVGPGNIYVALAKKAVFGYVSIDSIAGPSEILVLADESANPVYVAADMLSQAEHDELSSCILITTDETLAKRTEDEIKRQVPMLSKASIIEKSLENFGFILVADNIQDAVDAANEIASEHMEILMKNPFEVMTKVKNAGAIFIGDYSCEALGDYFAGPNHIIPTNGTAKFFSPLGVDDFIKRSSIISYSEEALSAVWKDVHRFAEAEGLTAHANSVAVRFNK